MSDASSNEILQELKALRRRVTELEDVNEIRKLQWKYGYYLDKCIPLALFTHSRLVPASTPAVLYKRRAYGCIPWRDIQRHCWGQEALH